jgi:hypothetical protein
MRTYLYLRTVKLSRSGGNTSNIAGSYLTCKNYFILSGEGHAVT